MNFSNTNRNNNKSAGSKTITPTAIIRIKNDIAITKKEILEGIHVVSDEADITQFHAIIEGPSDTPYAGGIFYFHIKMPNNYPWTPPLVSFTSRIIKKIQKIKRLNNLISLIHVNNITYLIGRFY